jgi:lipoate-protein ligase A
MGPIWRLVLSDPLDGPTNMAVDEALLRARVLTSGPPTVRFYAWRPATVSLGYAQPLDETVDRDRCATLGIGLVRRPTGGSAILHEGPEQEVTYSVVARAGDFAGADDVLETYRVIGQALAAGLGRLGVAAQVAPLVRGRRETGSPPAFCFQRTGSYEIAVGGRKLIGSAQRRQRGAFLQHGSVVLDVDPARVRAVFPGAVDPMSGMTTLVDALGTRPGGPAVVAALRAGFEATLGVSLVPSGLSPDEAPVVDALVLTKYGTEDWTAHGRMPVPAGRDPAGSAGGGRAAGRETR